MRCAAAGVALLIGLAALAMYPVNRFHAIHFVSTGFMVELREGQIRYFGYRDPFVWTLVRQSRVRGWSLHPPVPFFRFRYQGTTSSAFREVFVPYWWIAAAGLAAGGWLAWPFLRRGRRGGCARCGYPLDGCPKRVTRQSELAVVCPECGRVNAGADLVRTTA